MQLADHLVNLLPKYHVAHRTAYHARSRDFIHSIPATWANLCSIFPAFGNGRLDNQGFQQIRQGQPPVAEENTLAVSRARLTEPSFRALPGSGYTADRELGAPAAT